MQFQPRAGLTLLLITLAVLFSWLGYWQYERMHEKKSVIDNFNNAPVLDLDEASSDETAYVRVKVSGRYQPGFQLLLDNKMFQGRPGVHVFTLFIPENSEPLLINRGWLPMPLDRLSLPQFVTPSKTVSISGLLSRPNEDGVRLGDAEDIEPDSEAQLVTYLDMQQARDALDGALSEKILLLDATDSTGFQGRNWQPATILPSQHGAYSVQWFAMALAALMIWLALSFRRNKPVSPGPAAAGSTYRNRK